MNSYLTFKHFMQFVLMKHKGIKSRTLKNLIDRIIKEIYDLVPQGKHS